MSRNLNITLEVTGYLSTRTELWDIFCSSCTDFCQQINKKQAFYLYTNSVYIGGQFIRSYNPLLDELIENIRLEYLASAGQPCESPILPSLKQTETLIAKITYKSSPDNPGNYISSAFCFSPCCGQTYTNPIVIIDNVSGANLIKPNSDSSQFLLQAQRTYKIKNMTFVATVPSYESVAGYPFPPLSGDYGSGPNYACNPDQLSLSVYDIGERKPEDFLPGFSDPPLLIPGMENRICMKLSIQDMNPPSEGSTLSLPNPDGKFFTILPIGSLNGYVSYSARLNNPTWQYTSNLGEVAYSTEGPANFEFTFDIYNVEV